jgi:hypothetical protein
MAWPGASALRGPFHQIQIQVSGASDFNLRWMIPDIALRIKASALAKGRCSGMIGVRELILRLAIPQLGSEQPHRFATASLTAPRPRVHS